MNAIETDLDENLEYRLISSELIPEEWKPIIGKDMQRQRKETIIRPLSDAYYYGLPKRYHKRDKFTKTYSLKEYTKNAIKSATNGSTLEDNDIDSKFGQTSDLQIEFDECLKKLLKEHISRKYEGFDQNKFEHISRLYDALTITIVVSIGYVVCEPHVHRPTRRELQTNKTVFMHCCFERGICKDYIAENALNHLDCKSLCELSWKWAHTEAGSDPSITLPPEENDVEGPNMDESGDGQTSRTKSRSATNFMLAIGPQKMSRSEGGIEQRESQSQNRSQIGRSPPNIVKAMEQKIVEVKASVKSSDGKSDSNQESEGKEEKNDSKSEDKSEDSQSEE